jgi:hypothetical protein
MQGGQRAPLGDKAVATPGEVFGGGGRAGGAESNCVIILRSPHTDFGNPLQGSGVVVSGSARKSCIGHT